MQLGRAQPEQPEPSPSLHLPQSPVPSIPLPSFIGPFPPRIPPEDLEFLARKGALSTPEPELHLEILHGYLISIHPFMPMLDFKSFANAILSHQQDFKLSLLLFQAVMFAGLNSLSLPTIHRLLSRVAPCRVS